MRRASPAVGAFSRKDKNRERPQIVIRFDRETFDHIAAIAKRNGWSFNGVTRLLIEWGLEDLKDGETLLPLFTEGRRNLARARNGKRGGKCSG